MPPLLKIRGGWRHYVFRCAVRLAVVCALTHISRDAVSLYIVE